MNDAQYHPHPVANKARSKSALDAARADIARRYGKTLDTLERNVDDLNAGLMKDSGARLAAPDIMCAVMLIKISQMHIAELKAMADEAEDLPNDPRYAKLGFALSCGDLSTCWPMLKQIGAERARARKRARTTGEKLPPYVALEVENDWIPFAKVPREEIERVCPDMPSSMKEAIDAAHPEWDLFDGVAMYQLLTALPRWDVLARYGRGEIANPDTHLYGPDENDPRVIKKRKMQKIWGEVLREDEKVRPFSELADDDDYASGSDPQRDTKERSHVGCEMVDGGCLSGKAPQSHTREHKESGGMSSDAGAYTSWEGPRDAGTDSEDDDEGGDDDWPRGGGNRPRPVSPSGGSHPQSHTREHKESGGLSGSFYHKGTKAQKEQEDGSGNAHEASLVSSCLGGEKLRTPRLRLPSLPRLSLRWSFGNFYHKGTKAQKEQSGRSINTHEASLVSSCLRGERSRNQKLFHRPCHLLKVDRSWRSQFREWAVAGGASSVSLNRHGAVSFGRQRRITAAAQITCGVERQSTFLSADERGKTQRAKSPLPKFQIRNPRAQAPPE